MSELTESTEYPPLDKNSELKHLLLDSFRCWWVYIQVLIINPDDIS